MALPTYKTKTAYHLIARHSVNRDNAYVKIVCINTSYSLHKDVNTFSRNTLTCIVAASSAQCHYVPNMHPHYTD